MTHAPPTARDRSLIVAAAIFLVVGLLVAAWNVPLPLIAYSPGPVSDAADAVIVEGTETFDPEGGLIVLTVLSQDINIFEALVAAVDPAVDVLARQVVRRPDESDEDYRRRNLRLMDQATETAVAAALARLDTSDLPPKIFITGYAADTPAGEVLEIGDRILSLGGIDVEQAGDLAEILADRATGDVVGITVERDGDEVAYQVELAASEDEPDRPLVGIFVRQLPYWIDVDPGIVGGPSAGLMFTLAIIDVLTEGDLTGGNVVSGTGTIDVDGNVGSIGGIRQKVVAAEAAGANYLLVPEGNYEAAQTAPRTSIELVPVATLDEALAFLGGLPEV